MGSSREDILESLVQLKQKKITNILCLRGDPPQGATHFSPPPHGFRYASELVQFVREKMGGHFKIGVAGYPEGHVECSDKKRDLDHLKIKVDAGADYILTQLFFDNKDYFDFVDRAKKTGVSIEIIPGIMPVTNYTQLSTFTKMCGAKVPEILQEKLQKIKDDPEAIRSCGVEYAIEQCKELLKNGVSGLHFYILNQSSSMQRIYEGLALYS